MPYKLNFLIAEDNPGDVFLIRRALDAQKFSYELTVAKDGEEAIRYIEEAASGQREIDLLLLDLNLPRRDGGEVLAELRSWSSLSNIPAVMLTSSDSSQDRTRCMALGATGYFQKPNDLMRFLEIGKLVRDLLESRSSAA